MNSPANSPAPPPVEEERPLEVYPVVHESPIPAYLQVEQDLRRVILKDRPTRIPAEVKLAELYGVSRVTVRQSLQRLATAGLIRREHGRGTCVVPQSHLSVDLGLLRSATVQLREQGYDPKVTILEQSKSPPPTDIAEALDISRRESAVKIARLISVDGVPLSLITSWFRAKLVPGLEKAALTDRSVWTVLQNRYGITPIAVDKRIEVVESSAIEEKQLQSDFGTSLLKLVGVIHDDSGRPIEYSMSLWRPSHIRFSFSQAIE